MTSNGLPCAVLCTQSQLQKARLPVSDGIAHRRTRLPQVTARRQLLRFPHQSSRTCRGAEPRAARELDDLDCSRTPEGVADIKRRWQCPARTWIGSTCSAAYYYTTTPHLQLHQLSFDRLVQHIAPRYARHSLFARYEIPPVCCTSLQVAARNNKARGGVLY
jgi:hypothetical protein